MGRRGDGAKEGAIRLWRICHHFMERKEKISSLVSLSPSPHLPISLSPRLPISPFLRISSRTKSPPLVAGRRGCDVRKDRFPARLRGVTAHPLPESKPSSPGLRI